MSRIGLASAFMATVVLTSTSPLRVIRVSPEADAEPIPEIAVTFDRPVAGGLRASADPADFFSIDPEVSGRLEWRDPFTVRLLPDRALTPGQRYTVTLANTFEAMDGNRLARPYQHSFSVRKGRVLNGFPMRKEGYAQPRHVGVRPLLRFLVRPWIVDSVRFTDRTRIRILEPCPRRTIDIEWVAQRPMDTTDPSYFRWEEWHPRINDGDDGRRVVEVRPVEDLPRGCAGELEFPANDGDSNDSHTWGFRTYGPQRVTGAACSSGNTCPVGPLRIRFDNPVRGADLLRHLSTEPAVELTVFDTSAVQEDWSLTGPLQPRSTYAVTVSGGLTDLFDQPLGADTVIRIATTGYGTGASYEQGRLLVEREQSGTLPVHHINADTLHVVSAAVPRRLEGAFLASRWGWRGPWDSVAARADTLRLGVQNPRDQGWVSSVPLSALAPPNGTLMAVRVQAAANGGTGRHGSGAIALTQVTDLAVHARIGSERGMVWVTDVSDGSPKAAARVTLYDPSGNVRGSGLTDATGLVDLGTLRRSGDEEACARECYGFEGYVSAELDGDRALVGLSRYDPDLAPWRFDVNAAWGSAELPLAAAAFTDRGIYRPGERVHAKVLLRRGPLGSLVVQSGDSVRLKWLDRERAILRDTVVDLTAYGSATTALELASGAAIGNYTLEVEAITQSEWTTVGYASFRVAEYRPPEFLVEAAADRTTSLTGDTATVTVSGRYLFGAPMVGAAAQWSVRLEPLLWGLRIPGADGFTYGAGFGWWDQTGRPGPEIIANGVDSLDGRGATRLTLPLEPSWPGIPYRATLQATIADANRQTSTAAASLTVHPATFYIGARTPSDAWFWTAGEPAGVDVVAFTPSGARVEGVEINGQVVRREWHRVRRVRNGTSRRSGSGSPIPSPPAA